MKILFLSVHEEQEDSKYPSLGLYRMQHFLRTHGYACDICEYGLEDHIPYLNAVRQGDYDIIGVSGTYFFLESELEVAALFHSAGGKKPLLLAGGQSPSRAPEFWLDLGFDAVVRGYGEYPMLELAQVGQACGGDWKQADMAHVQGLAYRGATGVVCNTLPPMTRELFTHLNYELVKSMPIPPFWVHFMQEADERRKKHERAARFYSMPLFTSHKCPNRCGYCSSSNFLEKVYGPGSAGQGLSVAQTVDLVVHYHQQSGQTNFNFSDDDFSTPKRFILEFCSQIIALKKQGVLPDDTVFHCNSRVLDFIDVKSGEPAFDLLTAMKAAGFTRLALGVENFSNRLLSTPIMNKKGYDEAAIARLSAAFEQIGIEYNVNFMFVVPESTREEVLFNINKLLDVQESSKGIASLNMRILSFLGSDAFSSPQYPTVESAHISPINGKSYIKKEYYIPFHDDVRDALHYYMHGGVQHEIDRTREKYGPDVNVNDLCIYNMIRCNVIAKCLQDEATAQRIERGMASRVQAMKVSTGCCKQLPAEE